MPDEFMVSKEERELSEKREEAERRAEQCREAWRVATRLGREARVVIEYLEPVDEDQWRRFHGECDMGNGDGLFDLSRNLELISRARDFMETSPWSRTLEDFIRSCEWENRKDDKQYAAFMARKESYCEFVERLRALLEDGSEGSPLHADWIDEDERDAVAESVRSWSQELKEKERIGRCLERLMEALDRSEEEAKRN